MKTNFDFVKNDWLIDRESRLARHDLVFEAPPFDPVQYGLPLGNGDIGALIWCEPQRLCVAFNKCDLWDDSPGEEFSNWRREEEERSTVLRHGCRIIIDFGAPVFDEFYISDFNARLRVEDGLVTIHAVTPFGTVDVEAFVMYDRDIDGYGAFMCRVRQDMAESHDVTVALERYGSRAFAHWYNVIVGDTSLGGLAGTDSSADDRGIYITHKLPCGSFACGLALDRAGSSCRGGTPDASAATRGSHVAYYSLPNSGEFTFASAITSPKPDAGTGEVSEIVNKALAADFDALLVHSRAGWAEFWDKSYIDSGDDFADNVWYLNLLYMRESQSGRYPGRFIDGLWASARDYQAWDFYFHWNQQELYWPLGTSGHPELCGSYLDYRFGALETSKESAKKHYGIEGGAFVSDVCDRKGRNSLTELHNHTPVAEIALDFWRQYKFTGDESFLREKALPYMRAAAKFMSALYERGDDGLYHAKNGTGYEGWLELRDSSTELAIGKALFNAVLDALAAAGESDPDAELWRDIAENMAPRVTRDGTGEFVTEKDGKYFVKSGPFAGRELPDAEIAASGYFISNGEAAFSNIDGIFPTVDKAPVFPCGTLGIKDKGTREYDVMVNTEIARGGSCMGWDPTGIEAARLGLADETEVLLQNHIEKWLIFSNGFGHYGLGGGFPQSYRDRFSANTAENTATGRKAPNSEWLYRHMGLECSAVISCIVCDRLLQSHDGVVRVFPAYADSAEPGCETREARFTLLAEGGFRVSAERRGGETLFVSVTSLHGGALTMENPWAGESAACRIGSDERELTGELLRVQLRAGETAVFARPGAEFEPERRTVAPNSGAKTHRSGRTLGRVGLGY